MTPIGMKLVLFCLFAAHKQEHKTVTNVNSNSLRWVLANAVFCVCVLYFHTCAIMAYLHLHTCLHNETRYCYVGNVLQCMLAWLSASLVSDPSILHASAFLT